MSLNEGKIFRKLFIQHYSQGFSACRQQFFPKALNFIFPHEKFEGKDCGSSK